MIRSRPEGGAQRRDAVAREAERSGVERQLDDIQRLVESAQERRILKMSKLEAAGSEIGRPFLCLTRPRAIEA